MFLTCSSSSAGSFLLPRDIIWLIASEVANPNGRQWIGDFTAIKDITRFRLVCKEFDVAGKTMLIKALRDGSEHHRVVRLPPRSGSLSDLKAVLCDGGFASVITDIRILFHPIYQNEHLEEHILEVLQSKSQNGRTDRRFPWADILSTLSFNIARIRHQCQQQEQWYHEVYSPTGMEQLRAVSRAIESVEYRQDHDENRTVHFEQLDYWWGHTAELQAYGLGRKFESCPHPMTGNFMLRVLTDLRPNCVEFNELELPRFEGLPEPASLIGSTIGSLPLDSLTDFTCSGLRFPASASGASGNIINFWAARQLTRFLSCAPNIGWLTLDLDTPNLRSLQDKIWLNSIFAHTTFPNLTFLRLSYAQFDVEHLMTFLTRHQEHLDVLQLQCFRAGTPNDLLVLVRHIRSMSCFASAKVTLEADLQELSVVINELRALIEDREPQYSRGVIENHENEERDYGLFWYFYCD